MKILLSILLLSSLTLAAKTKEYEIGSWGYPEDKNVVVLTDKTYHEFINKHEYVLAEFYAPWCGHCKELAPQYAKAAKKLKDAENPVPLVKVDATKETKLAEEFNIGGYPTLKWVVNGKHAEFEGPRTAKEIVNWVKKKTGPPSLVFDTTEKLEEFKKEGVVAVFFGEENDAFQTFYATGKALENVQFAHTFNADIVKDYGANSIVLFKNFDEGRNDFSGELSKENLTTWVEQNRYEIVMEFEGDAAIDRVFTQESPAIFFFRDGDKNGDKLETFTEVAKKRRHDIIFSRADISKGLGQNLAEYVGVSTTDVPTIRIAVPSNGGDMSKYLYEGDFSYESVNKFVDDFKNGLLSRFYKTQAPPATNDEPVKVVVGGQHWEEMVMNNDKDVFVEFYAPWCGHCKKLAPKYEKLAKNLAYLSDNLMIAKVDSIENEIPGVTIDSFPTMKLFKKGAKNDPVNYEDETHTTKNLTKWLKKNVSFEWKDPAPESETKAETDL